MMSSAREHHAKAEQLLEQAHTEHDSTRRSQILAEAQVHATLALIAAPTPIPSDPGSRRPPRSAAWNVLDTGPP
jgi:hypothetical protein